MEKHEAWWFVTIDEQQGRERKLAERCTKSERHVHRSREG